MTDNRSVFHLISDITKEEGVPCVLIGGFAVNFHKFSRQTRDVDLLMTRENYDKISKAFKIAGYKELNISEAFVNLESTRISFMKVDCVFVDQETLDQILSQSQELVIAKQKFLVPSLFHLIALKLHAIKNNFKLRFLKDLPDIVSLVRINNVDVKDEKFKELCLKYGTEDIYKRILEVC